MEIINVLAALTAVQDYQLPIKVSFKENISIIGFPVDLGSGRRGVDMGPSALRIAGLQGKLKNLGYKVNDTGDVKIEIMEKQKIGNPKLRYLDEILKTSSTLAGMVEFVLDKNNFPLWSSTTSLASEYNFCAEISALIAKSSKSFNPFNK